jgi:hypothetical protein
MDGIDATRNRFLGALEDGVAGGGQLVPNPIFLILGFQLNHRIRFATIK